LAADVTKVKLCLLQQLKPSRVYMHRGVHDQSILWVIKGAVSCRP